MTAISNAFIAGQLLELAQFLAEDSKNSFKVKAYRRAARTIRALGDSFDALVRTDADLTQYPGIGKAIASAIQEIVQTGALRQLAALHSQATPERVAIARYPGLDAKRVLRIYKKLKISSIEELRHALDSGDLAASMGSRVTHYVREALTEKRQFLLYEADRIATSVETFLLDRCRVTRADYTGDYRRRCEVVSDLSFLVETRDFSSVCQRLQEFGGETTPVAVSEKQASFHLPSEMRVNLLSAKADGWGTALVGATGSEKHLLQLDKACRGWRRFAAAEETQVYRHCDLAFVEPELREGGDEIKLAKQGGLPRLVTLADIRGELHSHTTASDGKNTIGQMAAAARKRGYEYIGITDHSQSLKIAGGLSVEQLWDQIREIDQWNERLEGIRVLKASEVDILADGKLDYPDELLKELDYTVCSIHSRFGLGKAEQTERVLRAMDNRYFTILGHATGRLLLKRPGYELDIDRVVRHAAERKCFFEINSSPDRLDLSTENARLAAAAGIRIAINTDAHGLRDFDLVRYGIDVARRAGLGRESVLNTMSGGELGMLLANLR